MVIQTRIEKIMDGISYFILILNIFFVPLLLDNRLSNLYIIPKQYVFSGLVLINILFLISKFVFTKKIQFLKTSLDIPLLSITVIGLLSAVFSANIYDSFFGRAEYFTLNFLLLILFICFYYIVVNIVKTEKKWRGLLDSVLAVGFVSMVIFLSKTVFSISLISKYIGSSWNTVDSINSVFGVWVVILFILSFGQLMKKHLGIVRTILSLIVGVLSMIVLMMLSFNVLWIILLISLVIMLMLGVSFAREVSLGWVSALFAVLVFSIIFIIFGSPKFIQVPVPTEIALGLKPSWSITHATIFSGVKDFFVGSGLGSFGVDFSMFRNPSFNADPAAWSLRFNQPFNTLFSLISEGGVLLVCAIVFLILLAIGHVFDVWNKIRTSNFFALEEKFKKDDVLFESFLVTVAFVVLSVGLCFVFYSQVLWMLWWLLLALLVTGFSFYNKNFTFEKEFVLENTPQYSLSFSFGLIVVTTSLVMITVWGGRLYLGEIVYAKALSSGNLDMAQTHINEALRKKPNSDVYHSALAQMYLSQAVELSKQPNPEVQAVSSIMAKAVNEAKFATDISPKSVVLWENLATMYENASTLVPEAREWAIKALIQARDLEPTNPSHWWRLGNSFGATAKWEEAIVNYKKAIELKPDYYGAYLGLSNAYEQTQKFDLAIEIYKKIVAQNQSDPETLYNYGRLLYNHNRVGERELAEKIWNQVIKIQPNYSNALYSLGLLYETKGDKATALQYYYKVKDLNPNNKNIADKIKKMVGSI